MNDMDETGFTNSRNLRSTTLAKRKVLNSNKRDTTSKKRRNVSNETKEASDVPTDVSITVKPEGSNVALFPIFEVKSADTSKISSKTTTQKGNLKYFPLFHPKKTNAMKQKLISKRKNRCLPITVDREVMHVSETEQSEKDIIFSEECSEVSSVRNEVTTNIEISELPRSGIRNLRQLKKVSYDSEVFDMPDTTEKTFNKKVPKKKKNNSKRSVNKSDGGKDLSIHINGTKNGKQILNQFLQQKEVSSLKSSKTHDNFFEKPSVALGKQVDRSDIFPCYSHSEHYFQQNTCDIIFKPENEVEENTLTDIKWNSIRGLVDLPAEFLQSFLSKKEIIETHSTQKLVLPAETHTDAEVESLWTDSQAIYDFEENLNDPTLKKITLWLTDWKSKCLQKKEIQELDKCSSEEFDDDFLDKAIIITGLTGTGKTSIVNWIANKLGFTVLEVNVSSCRSGRNITSKLQEAFQSYHVEGCNSNSSKNLSVLKMTDKQVEKCNTTITRHLKLSEKQEIDLALKNSKFAYTNECSTSSSNLENSIDNSKLISNLTLILFDDVDVVFDEEDGFWSSINTFLKTTKKPVVLTASRHLQNVKNNLTEQFPVFNINITSTTAAKCLSNECQRWKQNEPKDLNVLVRTYMNDIRRCLLHIQFWHDGNLTFACDNSGSIRRGSSKLTKELETLDQNLCVNFPLNPLFISTNELRKSLVSNSYQPLLNTVIMYHLLGNDILSSSMFQICFPDMIKACHSMNHVALNQSFNSSSENFPRERKLSIIQQSIDKSPKQDAVTDQEFYTIISLLEHFSFSDSLKGQMKCNTLQWQSTCERLKNWMKGLPTATENEKYVYSQLSIELISLCNIISLKKQLYSVSEFLCSENNLNMISCDLDYTSEIDSINTQSVTKLTSVIPPSQKFCGKIAMLDYLTTLRHICDSEAKRVVDNKKRGKRFLHYFDSINLPFEPSDLPSITKSN